MVDDVDVNQIEQIISNVHKKKTTIYIPCLKTYNDFLGEKNEFYDSVEIFFEYAALHKSKGIELKMRMDPVRIFRTSPISDALLEIARKDYEKNKSIGISNAVALVFGATDPHIFESVMHPQLSIFEKAIILKEECKDSANIVIISNDPNIDKFKRQAEEEGDKTFTDDDFIIINTNKWLEEMFVKKEDPEVTNVVLNILRKKKEIK